MTDRSDPMVVYGELLQLTTDALLKAKNQGFIGVQVFGAKDRTCPVCRSLIGQVLSVTTPATDILRPDCERFKSGAYHCAPCVSPVIKDGADGIRFDR